MDSFEISFDVPRAGWLPIRLALGGESVELKTSNVLNNPMHELASAARGLLLGDLDWTVHFWLEPDTYILHLQSDDSRSNIQLRLFYTRDTELEVVTGELVVQATLPFKQVCKALLRSLERCDAKEFREVLDTEWRAELPTQLMREARDLLR